MAGVGSANGAGEPAAAAATLELPLAGSGKNIRIRTFNGDRKPGIYESWKDEVRTLMLIYGVEQKAMAPLLYLALEPGVGRPRDLLRHLDIQRDLCNDKGVDTLLTILDEEYLGRAYRRAEEAAARYYKCRREPGQSMSDYVSQLKVAKRVLEIDDAGTRISDTSFGQRLLLRCGLPKPQRRAALAAAGATWNPEKLAEALILMYHDIHDEEGPQKGRKEGGTKPQWQNFPRPDRDRDRRRGKGAGVLLTHVDDAVWLGEEPDEEDFDEDFSGYDGDFTGAVDEEDADSEDGIDDPEASEPDVDLAAEAFAAGYRQGRARGRAKGAGRGSGKRGRCADCHKQGHWRGDPECEFVKSGRTPLFVPSSAAGRRGGKKGGRGRGSGRSLSSGSAAGTADDAHLAGAVFAGGGQDFYSFGEPPPPPLPPAEHEALVVIDAKRRAADGPACTSATETRDAVVHVVGITTQAAEQAAQKAAAAAANALLDVVEAARGAAAEGLASGSQASTAPPVGTEIPNPDAEKAAHRAAAARRDASADQVPLPPQPPAGASEAGAAPPPPRAAPASAPPRERREGRRASCARSHGQIVNYFFERAAGDLLDFEIDELGSLFKDELQTLCTRLGRPRGGTKDVLINRLREHFATAGRCMHENTVWGGSRRQAWRKCRHCGLRVEFIDRPLGGRGGPDALACDVAWVDTPVGCMLMDSGCRRCVAGSAWHKDFQALLRKFNLKPLYVPCQEIFRFGNDSTETADGYYEYPVAFFGGSGVLRVSEVSSVTPPLFSRAAMAANGLTVDFGRNTVTRAGRSYPLESTKGGHLLIKLDDWNADLLASVPSHFRSNDTAEHFRLDDGTGQVPLKDGDSLPLSDKQDGPEEVYEADWADMEFKSVLKRGVRKRLRRVSFAAADALVETADAPEATTAPPPAAADPGRSEVPRRVAASRSRRPVLLEMFTATAALSLMASSMGFHVPGPVTIENGMDCTSRLGCRAAWQHLQAAQPDLIVCGFPCTAWSRMQGLNARTPARRAALEDERNRQRFLLRFVARVALWQVNRGASIVLENPLSSAAWHEPVLAPLFKILRSVKTDFCAWGLRDPQPPGLPIRKPTLLLTNDHKIAALMDRRCPGHSEHQDLFGRRAGPGLLLSAYAGRYTDAFCRTLLRAFLEHFDPVDALPVHSLEDDDSLFEQPIPKRNRLWHKQPDRGQYGPAAQAAPRRVSPYTEGVVLRRLLRPRRRRLLPRHRLHHRPRLPARPCLHHRQRLLLLRQRIRTSRWTRMSSPRILTTRCAGTTSPPASARPWRA